MPLLVFHRFQRFVVFGMVKELFMSPPVARSQYHISQDVAICQCDVKMSSFRLCFTIYTDEWHIHYMKVVGI